jgi:ubiquinone/menaquinone biosynthesis C-methylase UbiE
MVHRHDVDRFNRMAPTYDRHWLQRIVFEPVQRTVLELAQETVANPSAILDVGCGTGRLLRIAASRFPRANLVGIDAAAEMVKQAQASIPDASKIRFQQAVAENLPFQDHQFDLVFSTLTFHHWTDQAKGLSEVGRVLAPGGRWLLADVMPTGLLKALFRVLGIHHFPEQSQFEQALRQSDLRPVAQRRVPGLGGQLNVVAIGR